MKAKYKIIITILAVITAAVVIFSLQRTDKPNEVIIKVKAERSV